MKGIKWITKTDELFMSKNDSSLGSGAASVHVQVAEITSESIDNGSYEDEPSTTTGGSNLNLGREGRGGWRIEYVGQSSAQKPWAPEPQSSLPLVEGPDGNAICPAVSLSAIVDVSRELLGDA
jgi:hypothetical protein